MRAPRNQAAILCLIGVVLALASCTTMHGTSQSEVREAIEASAKQWEAGVRSGSGAAIAAVYAEDAQVFPPNGDIVTGREAIAKLWQDFLDTGVKDVKLTVLEVEVQGNLAVEIGRYDVIATNDKALDSGKYVAIHKRVGGGWKLYRDIWNTSLPSASQ